MDTLFTINNKPLGYFRIALVIFFILAFIAAICYWFYEIYTIYDTNIPDIDDWTDAKQATNALTAIYHETVHSQVAFEAAILSFLLAVAAYRL